MNILSDHEDDDDSLSLSDLPLQEQQGQFDSISSLNNADQHHTITNFEFSTSTSSSENNNDHLKPDDLVFCGKILGTPNPDKFYYTPRVIHPTKITNERNTKKKEVGSKRLIPAKNLKHRVLIGLPAKIPTKMKLSDIKERQSRQAPTQMFPPDGDVQKGLIRKPHLHICGLAKASLSCFPRANKACVRN